MKEPDYIMSLMSTYMGPINIVAMRQLASGWMGVETAKQSNPIILNWLKTTSCTASLLMTTTIKQHSPIILEVVWATKYWTNRVFSIFLSVTEVNINLAATYFGGPRTTNMSDQLSQEIGQDINLQYPLQQGQ